MALQLQNLLNLQTRSTISLLPLLLKLKKVLIIHIGTFLIFLEADLMTYFSNLMTPFS